MDIEPTTETIRSILDGREKGWAEVPGTRHIIDQGRWTTTWASVHKHTESGRHFEIVWDWGSTETQEDSETEPPICYEVVQKEVTETKWVPIAQ